MQEKDYEALCDMFTSEGWKLFMENITDLEQNVTQVAPDAADTNDKWQYARGKIHQLRNLMGFENFIKVSWEQSLPETHEEDGIDVDVI